MRLVCVIVVIAAALAGPAADVWAQVTSSSRPLSPTVLVSHVVRDGEIALLVLWRGSPGWFWRSEGGREGAGGSRPDCCVVRTDARPIAFRRFR
jgi:hypothetical protein